jgi:threonine/homoserine/homoserine lactone efflux protein
MVKHEHVMYLGLLLKGILIGFSIAMPVGPIGLLCIRNSLTWGMRYGFATGLGAAVADTVYGAIAGFGVAALTSWLLDYKLVLQIVGGIFLIYLGIKSALTKITTKDEITSPCTLWKVFLTTFLLTLTNPMTILSFVAIYAGLGVVMEKGSYLSAALLTAGVFIGSILWWLILSYGAGSMRDKLKGSGTLWMNRISGAVLILFGVAALCIR